MEAPGSLFIRAVYRRKVLTLTLPYRLYPSEWDMSTRSVILHPSINTNRKNQLRKIKSALSENIQQLQNHIQSLKTMNIDFTVYDMLDILRHKKKDCLLKGYAARKARELKISGQERTAEAYLSTIRSFQRFNKGNDTPISRLDVSTINRYEIWLKTQGRSLNTISFYMRNLRAIYNRAIGEGIIEGSCANPFIHVYTGVQKTRKRALTKEEVCLLDNLDFTHTHHTTDVRDSGLDLARDIFLFCFHARGMSFVDVAYLRKSDLREGIITYLRRKTGQLIEVRVTTAMQAIIDRHKLKTENSPFLFPLITNCQKPYRNQYLASLRLQNSRLHRIAHLLGFKKKLTTHVSRHSWATIAKGERLPLWVISEGLGHSSERMTYTYLASFDRTILDKAVDKVSKAIKKAG